MVQNNDKNDTKKGKESDIEKFSYSPPPKEVKPPITAPPPPPPTPKPSEPKKSEN